jgi:predicted nucleic acid-binding protein
MSTMILLDAGPLGLATHPKAEGQTFLCNRWIFDRLAQRQKVFVPEISDYEVRRELIRVGKARGLAKLDQFKIDLGYLPLTTATMLLAAELWAEARRLGRPNTSDHALDADVILSAQAMMLERGGHQVIVATTNLKHLSLFVDARLWSDIT